MKMNKRRKHGKYILIWTEITLETEADIGANVQFHFAKLGRKISKANVQMWAFQFNWNDGVLHQKDFPLVFSIISLGSSL